MGGGAQGVLKQGICSIALGVSELMVGEAPAPRGLKSPAIHHDLSAPALLGSACSTPPSPSGKFQHGCPGYLNCILRPEGWLWPYCTEARPICVNQAGLVCFSVCSFQGPSSGVLCFCNGLFGFTKHTKLCHLHAMWALPRVISGGFLGVLF